MINVLLKAIVSALIIGFILTSIWSLSLSISEGDSLVLGWTNRTWWELMLIITALTYIPVLVIAWLISRPKK
jgi:hypothetical protein